jgi:hypothetical protein
MVFVSSLMSRMSLETTCESAAGHMQNERYEGDGLTVNVFEMLLSATGAD